MALVAWAVLAVALGAATGADDWSSNCSAPCKCKWFSSRKTADCSAGGLSAVPRTLSPEIQQLNLSSNPIPRLTDHAFDSAGLVNLHKLYLRECGIAELHEDALARLSILIELDLSHNQIATLHPGTFASNERLRIVILSHNRVRSLPDGLFTDHQQLQSVLMEHCEVESVASGAFRNLPLLQTLTLDSNRLKTLQPDTFLQLGRLKSLGLLNNPWLCDCNLQPMITFARERRLVNDETSCVAPEALKDHRWGDVNRTDLACQPQVAQAFVERRFPNASLFCQRGWQLLLCVQVKGVPSPTAQWIHNTTPLQNSTRAFLREGDGWLNLTLKDVGGEDWGDYVCVARSAGGLDERNVSLLGDDIEGYTETASDVTLPPPTEWAALSLVLGLSGAALLLAVLLIVTLWFFCARRRGGLCRAKKVGGDGSSSNGDLSYHAGDSNVIIVDQQKSLITKVNPVRKPPRRLEAGDLDVKTSLLDDGSSLKVVPSVADSEEQVQEQEQSLDSLDTLTPRSTDGGPPDLLSFPSGRGQISPAGSSASTAPDSTRLPVQSPLYQHSPHLFGTLPYSRSQSPFSPAAPVAPRGGYVTIPRRPRVPSWSCPPNPLLLLDPLQGSQPAYDNLGPRTTADGSSVLSLNKSAELPPPPVFYSVPPPVEQRQGGKEDEGSPAVKPVKVPPKPPPKPKKKPVDAVAGPGPLYEDEGEDGTEV